MNDATPTSQVKAAIGEQKYEEYRALIQATFPGSPRPDDATVDGFVLALARQDGGRSLGAGPVDLPPEPQEPVDRGIGGPSYPLFIAHAVHHRVRAMTNPDLHANSAKPFESEFIGHLPVVRVPLWPAFIRGQNPCIHTQIGDVYLGSDHLCGSVALVAEKFAGELGYVPGKVDLITPARTGITKSRFGAIAVYLGYKTATDAAPSFFIFEAGMATGEAKMLYLGKTMDTVVTHLSGYHPTAYSSPDNIYTGSVKMNGNTLASMWVQGGPPRSDYYIRVSINYVPTTETSNDPFGLLVEAAKRIALIGKNMGQASGIPGGDAISILSDALPWVVKPAYGGTGTISRSLGEGEEGEP